MSANDDRPTALEVLMAVATEGVVVSDEAAVIDAVAHLRARMRAGRGGRACARSEGPLRSGVLDDGGLSSSSRASVPPATCLRAPNHGIPGGDLDATGALPSALPQEARVFGVTFPAGEPARSRITAGVHARQSHARVQEVRPSLAAARTRGAVCASGRPLSPTPVALPAGSIDEWEKYEGMLVTFPQPLSIAEYFNFARFNETVLTDGRQYQPTAVVEPGHPRPRRSQRPMRAAGSRSTTGATPRTRIPRSHPDGEIFTLDNRFRGGDTLADVTGVLDFAFGVYRIQPTGGADYTVGERAAGGPEDVGGNLDRRARSTSSTTSRRSSSRGAEHRRRSSSGSGRRSSPRSPRSTPTSSA